MRGRHWQEGQGLHRWQCPVTRLLLRLPLHQFPKAPPARMGKAIVPLPPAPLLIAKLALLHAQPLPFGMDGAQAGALQVPSEASAKSEASATVPTKLTLALAPLCVLILAS